MVGLCVELSKGTCTLKISWDQSQEKGFSILVKYYMYFDVEKTL